MSDRTFESSFDRNRRHILRQGLGLLVGASALGLPGLSRAAAEHQERHLSLYNLHTGERSRFMYWADGRYLPETLSEINYLLRDHRTDEVAAIDVELLDALYLLRQRLDNRHRFEVISGYRSPKTNRRLRQQGHGVAKKSFHMKGMAIDIRLPGTSLAHLHNAALDLRAGGVGYYPNDGFVHVDVGWVRRWRG